MTLTKAPTIINNLRLQEWLPRVDYRLMQDWRLKVTLIKTSVDNDFFGPTLNIRIKDYSWAPLNGLVVGLDLYEIMKNNFLLHSAYHFEEMKEQRWGYKTFGLSKTCSVFLVKRKTKDIVKYHYHHHLPFFSEKTSSSGITAGLCVIIARFWSWIHTDVNRRRWKRKRRK